MSAALRCAGLGHRYGRSLWGLRDCTVTVPAGRLVALVGPNGSGKTTLMSMAAGLLPASAGTVEVAGGTPAERLDRIGFVAQDAPLWPRLRVADVLEIGRCMNRGFDAAMAADRIRRLGLRPRARVSTLSGGHRAQLALTLVLAKKPELFLLEEPMANLDPLARREFLASMFEACSETGATVLYSSHSVAELERICDYLIVAIGAALAGFAVLLPAARWAVPQLAPAATTAGPNFVAPAGSWVLGSGTGVPVPYHPASQYWPLQFILLTVLLAAAAAALASGWRATRTRAV